MATQKAKDEVVPNRNALIFEMDNVALGGRRVRFEILKGILAEQGITLTPAMFSRYCLHSSPAQYMASFLNAVNFQAATPAQVLERMVNDVVTYMLNHRREIMPGLARFLDTAKAQGADIAAISMLTPNHAEELAEQLHFPNWGIRLFCFPQVEKNFPTADTWLEISKALGKKPRRCLAFSSSMASAKSALAAGMRVIAIPDDFTSFQDFGGVDLISDDLSNVKPDEFFTQIRFW